VHGDEQEMARNLEEEISRDWDGIWHRDIERRRRAAGLENETSVDKLAGVIGYGVTVDAFERRAMSRVKSGKRESRLTGEWIIFGRNNGKNVYLTLAVHDEAKPAANISLFASSNRSSPWRAVPVWNSSRRIRC
jgi:hypothetical protein